ncbi:MAG: prepilin-type N-terminal cleavage/methylation domain, partial [Capsulimonas sp.]|nr:prepilin-type N-terminal cleavage/methylation domain [Capsulimonas sp.]
MKKSCRQTNQAFSLIELLVVIAIIALLAAIIFPAFFTAKEKARQTVTISNMKEIWTAYERYRTDHGQKPPDVLFAYAYAGANMASVKSAVPQANHSDYLSGLYPQYINDPTKFTCPNNQADTSSTVSATVNKIKIDGTLDPITVSFYKADAFDVSPKITGANATDDNTMMVRYQKAWTPIIGPAGAGVSAADYSRQPFFNSPPGDTYV